MASSAASDVGVKRPDRVVPQDKFRQQWNRNRLEGLQFEIASTWDGQPIDDSYKFRLDWFFARRPGKAHKRAIKVTLDGPLFEDPEPPDEISGHCANLWDYEVFELFFANKKDEYLEIEVGPHGHWLVYLLNGVRKPFNKGEELDIEFVKNEFTEGGNRWHVEFIFPLAYLPAQVETFNAYAIHGSGSDRRYDALYPVTDGTFSEPDFHRLQFFKPIDLKKLIPEGLNDMIYTDPVVGPMSTADSHARRSADLRAKVSHWRQYPEFCAECGAILPLPDAQTHAVVCRLCGASWKAGNIKNKLVTRYEESFTKTHESEATSGNADGPEVDRICSHCGHDKMTYSTRQTRSADEGMTVFFKCTKCFKQDIEYS